jgi:hypothetical protein
MDWTGAKIQIVLMNKDPWNQGVDLCITQLYREGKIGTTWPWVHPHDHLSLMERLDAAVKKGLKEVHTHQLSSQQLLDDLT